MADIIDIANEQVLKNLEANQQALVNRTRHNVATIISSRECLNCGENIPIPRLIAIPHTNYCVDCQTEQEQIQKGHRCKSF